MGSARLPQWRAGNAFGLGRIEQLIGAPGMTVLMACL